MGLFCRKKSVGKKNAAKAMKNIIRIQVASLSTGSGKNSVTQGSAVVSADGEWSFNEFINFLIHNFCTKVSKRSATWILEYRKRALAVFNTGSGKINIINEKFIDISMKDLIQDDRAPQIFIHCIVESDLEETAKTMLNGI